MRAVRAAQIIAIALVCLAGQGYAKAAHDGLPEPITTSFAVYSLSRGKGVPEPARDLLRQARALLDEAKQQGTEVTIRHMRIGLEGETRLCAAFADPMAARDMLARIRELARDVELVNVAIESCSEK